MQSKRNTPQMKGWIGWAVAVLALIAGTALAATPSTSDYRYATQPMLTGRVVWVNEHQLAMETEQGEEILLALDTRSTVPVDLGPGMMMRVEFKLRNDGRRYVQRIIPIRSGMRTTRELAYSREHAGSEVVAQGTSTSDGEGVENGPGSASTAPSSTNQSLGTPLASPPSTHGYMVAMQPMIVGRVVTVNDHRIVVDTDQGQRVALEMDSGTIVPIRLASDMTVRVEYEAMEDGPKYAERIVQVSSPGIPGRLSYVHSPERREVMARVAAIDAPVATREPASLPQTASRQPLIALLGFLSLGAAGAVAIGRRLRVIEPRD
jgi:LPXTG-motif cell wall-anchored protein